MQPTCTCTAVRIPLAPSKLTRMSTLIKRCTPIDLCGDFGDTMKVSNTLRRPSTDASGRRDSPHYMFRAIYGELCAQFSLRAMSSASDSYRVVGGELGKVNGLAALHFQETRVEVELG